MQLIIAFNQTSNIKRYHRYFIILENVRIPQQR